MSKTNQPTTTMNEEQFYQWSHSAAAALAGLLSNPTMTQRMDPNDLTAPAAYAGLAVAHADALLAEIAKRENAARLG